MTNPYKLFYIQDDEVDYFGDSGWTYRKAITLSPATSVANYQVKIDLTTSNFDYSKAQSTGADLRFYQTDGTALDYWIETWNTSGTSTIWIEVATSGTSSIYMYYGNSTASAGSNGTNTFIAWHGVATTPFIDSLSSDLISNIVFEAKVRATAETHNVRWGLLGSIDLVGDWIHIQSFTGGNQRSLLSANDYPPTYTEIYITPSFTSGTWYKLKITNDGTIAHGYVDGSEISTGITTNLPNNNMGLAYTLAAGTGEQEYSFARKYVATESTSTLGSEETFASDIIPYTIDFKLERELEKLLDKLTLKCTRRIDDLSGFIGFDPNIELLLKFNEIGIFRGRCKTSNKKEYYTVEIFSSAEILSRTVVQEVYTNTTPEAIFTDLMNTYTDLTPNVTASGTTVERLLADGYISDIVGKLAEALGWLIYTDYSKNIYFQPRGTDISAITIQRQTSGSNAIFGEWKREHNEMCNHIQITGDTVNYNTQESFTGDFSSTIFTLSESPNTIKISVDSTELTPEEYAVAKETKIVTLDSAPASSLPIVMDYIYSYPIYAARQDNTSIAQYGRFSKTITNKWLKTRPDATAYANNYIDRYKDPLLYNNIIMSASYITSFTPGEQVRVIDDLESIDDYYVINKIKLEYLKGVVEINLGDYLTEFIGIQRVLQVRVAELEKSEMRLTLALNVSETETLVPAEDFDKTDVHHLNFKVQATYPAKCDETRDSLNDARVNLCEIS